MSSATSSNTATIQQSRHSAAALLLGAALSGCDGGAIGFLLPAVRAETGSDPQQAAWMVSLYALGSLVAIAAAGAAVRRFGSTTVFRVCAAVSACGSLLSGGPLRYAAARAVTPDEQGPAQAGVALLTNVGVMGGSLLVGALAARGSDERAAMESAMIAACGIMAVLFVPVLFLRPHSRHQT